MVNRWLHAVLLLAFCAPPAYASQTVKIGMTQGFTGRFADICEMQVAGYRLWEREVNAGGGLLGNPVKVVILDDGGDGSMAASLYEKLIVEEKVDLVFGPYSSPVTEAILPVTERHGFPVLVGGASSDSLWRKGFKRVFGVYTPASKYTVGFLEMLLLKKYSRLAILSADDSFSRSLAEGIRVWADRYGLELVMEKEFPKGTADFADSIAQVRASRAQTLIVCGHLEESIGVRKAMDLAGWAPQVYYASVGPVLQKYRDDLGESADLTFSSSQWEPHPMLNFPGSKEFLALFKEAYGVIPSYHAATAFASGSILEAAVKKAGSLDREKLAQVLSTMDHMSIIGRYGVDRSGMQIRQFPVIIQWQKGKKEIVWPRELQTAEPVFGGGEGE